MPFRGDQLHDVDDDVRWPRLYLRLTFRCPGQDRALRPRKRILKEASTVRFDFGYYVDPRKHPAPDTYAKVWIKSLQVDNIKEEWHLDVIQSQFLDGEARAARYDFIAKRIGRPTSLVSYEQRCQVVAFAARLLIKQGMVPEISYFWFPQLAADIYIGMA